MQFTKNCTPLQVFLKELDHRPRAALFSENIPERLLLKDSFEDTVLLKVLVVTHILYFLP